jgi:hypothetical protein
MTTQIDERIFKPFCFKTAGNTWSINEDFGTEWQKITRQDD